MGAEAKFLKIVLVVLALIGSETYIDIHMHRQTEMATSNLHLMLIENIHSLWGLPRLLPVTYVFD